MYTYMYRGYHETAVISLLNIHVNKKGTFTCTDTCTCILKVAKMLPLNLHKNKGSINMHEHNMKLHVDSSDTLNWLANLAPHHFHPIL